jgi:Uma2 family endonuclease
LVLGTLSDLLRELARRAGGIALFAPMRLRVRTEKFREPDLMFLRSAHDGRRQNAFWSGADLIGEILSADDPARYTVTKRADYAAAGIPEYWIVDPAERSIRILRLEGAPYLEAGLFRGDEAARSPPFSELSFTAAQVFADLRD